MTQWDIFKDVLFWDTSNAAKSYKNKRDPFLLESERISRKDRIKRVLDNLPEFFTAEDIVSLGICENKVRASRKIGVLLNNNAITSMNARRNKFLLYRKGGV